jgi:hypothetical protein
MRKIILLFLSLPLLVGIFLAIDIANAPSANASCGTGNGSASIGCTEELSGPEKNTPSVSNSGGGGGVSGGSGNGSGGTAPPPNPAYNRWSISVSCMLGSKYIPNLLSSGGYCGGQAPVNNGNGGWSCGPDGRGLAPISATLYMRTSIVVDGSDTPNGRATWLANWSCGYPAVAPDPNTLKGTKTCYTNYDATLYQSTSKDAIRSGGSLPQGASAPNARRNIYIGPASYVGCVESAGIGQFFGLNTPEQGGNGYYRYVQSPRYVQCSFYGLPLWTNNTDSDRYVCSGQSSAGSRSTYAINACNYKYVKFSSWAAMPAGVDFSVGACAAFQCNVLNPTTVNGVTGPVEVMRNGDNVNLQMSRISITGGGSIRNVTNIQAKNDVMKTSKPMNGNDDNKAILNAPNQYFKLKTAGTGKVEKWNVWENQDNNNKWLNFYWAGDASNSFRTERTYKYTAQFLVPVANDTSGAGGSLWQTDTRILPTSGPCTTQSDSIFVVRSVNN